MHTSTHPSHHPYHMWLACVRDMAFYVCFDLCSHHFLPLVLIPVLVMLYCFSCISTCVFVSVCVCSKVCSVVWQFVLQMLSYVFCYFFLIFQPSSFLQMYTEAFAFFSPSLSLSFASPLPASFCTFFGKLGST